MAKQQQHLSKSYLQYEYENVLLEANPTLFLLRNLFRAYKGQINLSDKQLLDLMEDIKVVKAQGLWDYEAEQKYLLKLDKDYKFFLELNKLPEAEKQRYYKNLLKGGLFEL